MILHIPSGFGKETGTKNQSEILASVNAINASTAQLSWAYLNGVITDFNNIHNKNSVIALSGIPQIDITNLSLIHI